MYTQQERLASRLRSLRQERGLTLEDLADKSAISRATLSRMEKSEVSPTAEVLGKLAAAYGMSISRLMVIADAPFAPHVTRSDQSFWLDPSSGQKRRIVSPPSAGLAGEVLECELPAAARIAYADPPRPGLEHHIIMQEGTLFITIDDVEHTLHAGDSFRYRLFGASLFQTGSDMAAKYILVLIDG